MHQSIITGNLGIDPVVKQVGNSTVTELSMYVYTGKDQNGEAQDIMYRINIWGDYGASIARKIEDFGPVSSQKSHGFRWIAVVTGGLAHPKIFRRQNGDPGLDLTVRADAVNVYPVMTKRPGGQTQDSDWGNPKNADSTPF